MKAGRTQSIYLRDMLKGDREKQKGQWAICNIDKGVCPTPRARLPTLLHSPILLSLLRGSESKLVRQWSHCGLRKVRSSWREPRRDTQSPRAPEPQSQALVRCELSGKNQNPLVKGGL